MDPAAQLRSDGKTYPPPHNKTIHYYIPDPARRALLVPLDE
jgi:hypothetical protein